VIGKNRIKVQTLLALILLQLGFLTVPRAQAGLQKGVEWYQGTAGIGDIPEGEESKEQKLNRTDGCARTGNQSCIVALSKLLVESKLRGDRVSYADAEVLYIVRSSFCPIEAITSDRDERDGPILTCSIYNGEMAELMAQIYSAGLLGMPRSTELAECWSHPANMDAKYTDEKSCWAMERRILGIEVAGSRPRGFSVRVYFP
jgi:hypothetical protein